MSRLTDSSEKLRQQLEKSNLYKIDDEYSINNTLITEIINNTSNIINPFSSFDFTNTLLGRVTQPNTPIQQLGTVILGKQFALTVKSNAAREFLPTIDLSIDAIKNKSVVQKNIDYKITRDTSTGLSRFSNFLSRLTGNNPSRSPFTKNPDIIEYIELTGIGQLEFHHRNVSKNQYILSNTPYINAMASQGFDVSANDELYMSKSFIPNNPYLFKFSPEINDEYKREQLNYIISNNIKEGYIEYGNDLEFINDLGKTQPEVNETINSELYGFSSENSRFVWGKDGMKYIFSDFNKYDSNFFNDKTLDDFNIKHGLLKYTQAILDASESKFINQTKKKYFDPYNLTKFIGYHGSGIYDKPSDIIKSNANSHITEDGIRQHNMLNPYGTYLKAIRFNGNEIYGGNNNSVLYKSVKPKIHPISTDNNIVDNTNMVFSIENLAVRTIKNDDLGIAFLDDDFGTEIPISEVGQLGGRVMWFPPYDIKLSETSISKHETTQFIGRSEPVYTYNTSERLATLSFKLLIDYPPQLLEFRGKDNFYKNAVEFFAYGGGKGEYFNKISTLQKQLFEYIKNDNLNNENDDINLENSVTEPPVKILTLYFPNDITDVNKVIDSKFSTSSVQNTIQNSGNFNDDFNNKIVELAAFFNDNVDNINKFSMTITGFASSYYAIPDKADEVNKRIATNRAESMRNYINSTIDTKNQLTYIVKGDNIISGTDSPSNTEQEIILARKVEIVISRTSASEPETQLTENTDNKTNIQKQINDTRKKIAELRTNIFKLDNNLETGRVRNGMENIEKDYFSPIFHSQTPEEFHRRLTFLQQCVRQGNSMQSASDLSSKNSAFGRQPVQVLRFGDFFHTKIIIDSIDFDYTESTWDLNPEGMGLQPMIADINMQIKIIGGQSLETPIAILQNANAFNYYANSTFYKNKSTYNTPTQLKNIQVNANNNISTNDVDEFKDAMSKNEEYKEFTNINLQKNK